MNAPRHSCGARAGLADVCPADGGGRPPAEAQRPEPWERGHLARIFLYRWVVSMWLRTLTLLMGGSGFPSPSFTYTFTNTPSHCAWPGRPRKDSS